MTVITGKNLPSSHSPPLPIQLLVNITSPSSSTSTLVNTHTQVHTNHTTALTTPTTTPITVNKKESETIAITAVAAVAADDSSGDSGADSEGGGGGEDLTYRLMTEIQDVLIEDFFPPLDSSTVPGNPGRLYVILP